MRVVASLYPGLRVAPLLLSLLACADPGAQLFGSGTDSAALPAGVVPGVTPSSILTGRFPDPAGNGVACAPETPMLPALGSGAWIGPEGGLVRLPGSTAHGYADGHLLEVPPGAVRQAVLFCLRVQPDNHLSLVVETMTRGAAGELTAAEMDFDLPVLLHVSYEPVRQALGGRLPQPLFLDGPAATLHYSRPSSSAAGHGSAVLVVELRRSKYAMAID